MLIAVVSYLVFSFGFCGKLVFHWDHFGFIWISIARRHVNWCATIWEGDVSICYLRVRASSRLRSLASFALYALAAGGRGVLLRLSVLSPLPWWRITEKM